MATVLFIALAALVLTLVGGTITLVVGLRHAPMGVEDEEGFHRTGQSVDVSRRSAIATDCAAGFHSVSE